jgi:hypothetical protein
MRAKKAQDRIRRFFAVGFFLFWLAVLYAGADHPPPPGFLLLVLIDLGCAVVVYYRTGTYQEWIKGRKKNRFWRVLGDGLLTGLVIAALVMIFPGGGEPSAPTPGLLDRLIWFAIVGLMGMVNSLGVYGLLVLLTKKIHPKKDDSEPPLDG